MTFRDLNFILKLEMAAKTFMLFDWLKFQISSQKLFT